MKATVHDITAAGLQRCKDRSAKGEVIFLNTGSPVLDAAKADPNVVVIDGDWLASVLDRLTPGKRQAAFAVARAGAWLKYGRRDEAAVVGMLFELLQDMQSDDELESFIAGAGAPVPAEPTAR